MSKEVNGMQIKKTITVTAATLLLSGAALGGVALAQSGGADLNADTSTPAVSAENSATDTDDVQEGDPAGPEVADANEAPEGAESEGAESDGPGGHEDPPGNVDHEFEGEE
jgi:phage repressor protein C with HTH and peptisase S24 domain